MRVVDMFGCAERLEKAVEMIQTMSVLAHPGALGAMLSSCKTPNNAEIAEVVANELSELETRNTGNYCTVVEHICWERIMGRGGRKSSVADENKVTLQTARVWLG
jgi:hypothetical protein